jgi:hypothetical protein
LDRVSRHIRIDKASITQYPAVEEIAMTKHLHQRMNQRGITRSMVELALAHGEWRGDRCVLNQDALQKLIQDFDRIKRVAMKALDKGGLIVVEAGGQEITAYRAPRRTRSRR